MLLDLFKRSFLTLLLLPFFLLSACGEDAPPVETVFPQNAAQCVRSTIPNQFIVHWKDGRRDVFKGLDRETLIEKIVEPQLKEIRRVDHDTRITISPHLDDLTTNSFESDANEKASNPNWGIGETSASVAWQKGIRGSGVKIAVIDSGVDYSHPKLSNQIDFNLGESGFDDKGQDKRFNKIDDDGNGYVDDYIGYNFAFDDADPSDLIGHGTHVAGIIAASHNLNNVSTNEVQGVAPDSKILPIAFIGNDDNGSISDALDAIDYAALRGADIINASWGGVGCDLALAEKIVDVGRKGILFVSASGNKGRNIDQIREYPASFGFSNQITVGSIGRLLGMAAHSNYGSQLVNLFAPGLEILSTLPYNGYGEMTGTSMATPFVTGALALMKSHRPTASISELKQALLTGVDKGNYLNSSTGRLNISKGLQELEKLQPSQVTP